MTFSNNPSSVQPASRTSNQTKVSVKSCSGMKRQSKDAGQSQAGIEEKKLSLHDQQLPPRPRTRRRSATRASVKSPHPKKKEQTPSPVLDACSLTETKKNNTTTTHQQQPTTNNNNQQTAPFARSRTERKRSLPAPCSLPTKAETKQEARAPHREPGTTDAPPWRRVSSASQKGWEVDRPNKRGSLIEELRLNLSGS